MGPRLRHLIISNMQAAGDELTNAVRRGELRQPLPEDKVAA
jgi:hypothetical protein